MVEVIISTKSLYQILNKYNVDDIYVLHIQPISQHVYMSGEDQFSGAGEMYFNNDRKKSILVEFQKTQKYNKSRLVKSAAIRIPCVNIRWDWVKDMTKKINETPCTMRFYSEDNEQNYSMQMVFSF